MSISSKVDPAVVAALALHQPAGVRGDDIHDLRTKRDRRHALRSMRKTWGSDAAKALERLQEAQIELGRLLAMASADAFAQRDVVMEMRRALDREIEKSRSAVGAGEGPGTGRYALNRLFGG